MVDIFQVEHTSKGMIVVIEGDVNIIIYFLLPIILLCICQEPGKSYYKSKKKSFHKVCILSKIVPKIRIHKLVGRVRGGSFPFSFEDDPQGVDHDFEVEGQGDVFDIKKVKFATFHHFFNVFCIAKLYHSPTGKTGFYF